MLRQHPTVRLLPHRRLHVTLDPVQASLVSVESRSVSCVEVEAVRNLVLELDLDAAQSI